MPTQTSQDTVADARFAHPVVDSDGHVMEPPDLWQRYMPASMKDAAPKPLSPDPLEPYMDVAGYRVPRPEKQKAYGFDEARRIKLQESSADGFSPATQFSAMDREGIDASVLFPSRGLVVMGVDGVDAKLTTEIAAAYNRWLNDFCSHNRSRLFGAGMIDPRDPEGACREARRVVRDYGFPCVFLRPNPVLGRSWHDPAYETLWSELEELDVPVCFHEGGSVYLPQVSTDRFSEHSFWHVCTHPMEQQMAMMSMLMGGVAERHPRLRMGFMECGAGWLPYWLWRMDEAVENEESKFTHLSLRPSEYARRQCFVSIDSDEQPGVPTVTFTKEPRVVWGSDYPHPDSKYPHALRSLAGLDGMDSAGLKGILWDGPKALFGERISVNKATRVA